MSKDFMIVFVYDTSLVKHEYDDPASAVIYFCPSWIPEESRTSLCGQIIGTTHFLKTVFHRPHVISLQNGKFCIKEFGKYIMAVGTYQNVPNWVLQHRTNFLLSLINLFHCDLEIMSTFYKDYETFIEKLHNMFESYLKVLNLEFDIHKMPDLHISDAPEQDVVTKAQKFLNSCQKVKYVLGGLILWNDRIIASQLNSLLTKCLLLVNISQNKISAESVMTDFQLPKDVHLLHVYLKTEDFNKLLEFRSYSGNQYYDNVKDNCEKEINSFDIPKSNSQSETRYDNIKQYVPNRVFCKTKTSNTKFSQSCDHLYSVLKTCPKKTSSLVDLRTKSNSSNSALDQLDKFVSKQGKRIKTSTLCDPLYPYVTLEGEAVSQNLYKKEKTTYVENNGKRVSLEKQLIRNNSEDDETDSSKYYSLSSSGIEISRDNEPSRFENYNLLNITETSIDESDHILDKNCSTKILPQLSNFYRNNIYKKETEKSSTRVDNLRCGKTLDFINEKHEHTLKDSSESHEYELVKRPPDCVINNIEEVKLATDNKNREENDIKTSDTCDDRKNIRVNDNCPELKECVLLLLYHNNAVINFILEDKVSRTSDVINTLYEGGIKFLELLCESLDKNFENDTEHSSTSSGTSDTYSYLFTNQNWEYIKGGGQRESLDLNTVATIQDDLVEKKDITDLILRAEGNVIYGLHNENNIVYYQIPCHSSTGTPSSSDCMAHIITKARRRLSRTSRTSSLNIM